MKITKKKLEALDRATDKATGSELKALKSWLKKYKGVNLNADDEEYFKNCLALCFIRGTQAGLKNI